MQIIIIKVYNQQLLILISNQPITLSLQPLIVYQSIKRFIIKDVLKGLITREYNPAIPRTRDTGFLLFFSVSTPG